MRGLIRVQNLGLNSFTFGPGAPAGPSLKFRLSVRKIQQPTAGKAQIFTRFGLDVFPQLKTAGRQLKLALVAIHLAAPTPVPAGLFRADPTLFNQCDGDAALRQEIGGANAYDAATDHHDISLSWQAWVGLYEVQWCWHRSKFH